MPELGPGLGLLRLTVRQSINRQLCIQAVFASFLVARFLIHVSHFHKWCSFFTTKDYCRTFSIAGYSSPLGRYPETEPRRGWATPLECRFTAWNGKLWPSACMLWVHADNSCGFAATSALPLSSNTQFKFPHACPRWIDMLTIQTFLTN